MKDPVQRQNPTRDPPDKGFNALGAGPLEWGPLEWDPID
jgi:hypothetical protein